jgi:hypothetical protein
VIYLPISKNIFFIIGTFVQNHWYKSSSVAKNKNFIFGDLQIVALHPFYLGGKAQK